MRLSCLDQGTSMTKMYLLGISILCLITFVSADHPTRCPRGYTKVDNHCFLLVPDTVTFFEAHSLCDVVDGKVVEVTSDQDQTRVKNFLQGAAGKIMHVWMGATKLQGEWLFLSSSNEDAMERYASWAPTFPRNTAEDTCVNLDLSSGWRWENCPCTYHLSTLCEVTLRDDSVDTSVVG